MSVREERATPTIASIEREMGSPEYGSDAQVVERWVIFVPCKTTDTSLETAKNFARENFYTPRNAKNDNPDKKLKSRSAFWQ